MPTPELVDILAPVDGRGVGSERIKLDLADPETPARAFAGVSVTVDAELCDPEGLRLPLIYTVTDPDNRFVVRRTLRRLIPSDLVFIPQQGGIHRVTLRELAHNLWWGRLDVEVVGDPIVP